MSEPNETEGAPAPLPTQPPTPFPAQSEGVLTPEEQATLAFKRKLASKAGSSPIREQYKKQRALELSGLEADQENAGPSDWTLMRPDVGSKLGTALARGGMNAWNGIIRFANSASDTVMPRSSWWRPGFEESDNQKLDEHFAQRTDQQHYSFKNPITGEPIAPATFTPGKMDELAGPAQGGLFGIVESLTEFGIEFWAGGKILKGAANVPTALSMAGNALARGTFVAEATNAIAGFGLRGLAYMEKAKLLQGATQSAIKAAAFDDPYAERVSSFMAEAPPEVSQALAQYIDSFSLVPNGTGGVVASGFDKAKVVADVLKPTIEDNYGRAQAKNVLEDYLMGLPFAVAGLLYGGAVKGIRNQIAKKGLKGEAEKAALEKAYQQARKELLDDTEEAAAKQGLKDEAGDDAAKDAAAAAGIDDAAKDAAVVAEKRFSPTYVKKTEDGMWQVFRRELDTGVEEAVGAPTAKRPYASPTTREVPALDRTPEQKVLQVETTANRLEREQQQRATEALVESKRGQPGNKPSQVAETNPGKGALAPAGEPTNAGPGRSKPDVVETPGTVAPPRPTAKLADVPGPKFKTKTEAEMASGAINKHFEAVKAAKEPVTPEVMKAVRAEVGDVFAKLETPDANQIADILEKYGINLKYLQGADDHWKLITALVDELPEASKLGRRKPTTFASVIDQAKKTFGDKIDVTKLEGAMERLGIALHDAPAVMTAAKAVMVVQQRQLKKLSLLMDRHPGNQAIEDMVLKAMQNLHDVHAKFTSNNADAGRLLLIPNQIQSDDLAKNFSLGGGRAAADDGAAKAAAEGAEGAAEDVAAAEQKKALQDEMARIQAEIEHIKKVEADNGFGDEEAFEAAMRAEADEGVEAVVEEAGEAAAKPAAAEGAQVAAKPAAAEGVAAAEKKAAPVASPEEYAKRKAALEAQLKELKLQTANLKVQNALDKSGNKLGREEALDLARMIVMGDNADIDGIMKVIAGPKMRDIAKANPALKPSLMQRILGARVEFILSGFDTQMANVLSGMHRLVAQPAELLWYGGTRFDAERWKDGWELAAGQLMSFMDAARLSAKSFRLGQSIIDPGNMIKAEGDVGLQELSADILQRPFDTVRALAKYPSRTLMATDEFFSQIHYRAKARMDVARHVRQRLAEGSLEADGVKDLTERLLKATVDEGTGRGIYKAARDYAADATYRKTLTGSAETFQKFVNSNPVTQFFFPFVRAPANIFDYAWQSTPGLNLLNKNFQEMMAKGGEDAARATARAEFGTMMYGIAAFWAANGTITGGGPKDPKVKAAWEKHGYKPYTFTTASGERYQYRRGDPFLTALGVAADLWHASGDLEEQDRYSMASVIATSFAANATNKSYMSNVDTLFQAMSGDDPRKMQKLIGSAFHSSLVPAVVNDMNQDPYEREVVTVWDAIAARTPGFSEKLEPRMNILGDAVLRPPGWANRMFNPLTHYGPLGDEYAASELIKLGRALPDLPLKLDGTEIDLTNRKYFDKGDGKSPRTRWYELMGEIKDSSGMNMKDQLTALMKTESWKNLSDDSAYAEGGYKFTLASEILLAYREAAKGKLLEEYPKLVEALADETEVMGAGVAGGKAGANRKADSLRAEKRLLHRYIK